MALLAPKTHRTFQLFVRCSNCLRNSSMPLLVPDVPDAPETAEELEYSGALASVRFFCRHCESAIGQITGVSGGELV